MKYSLLFVVFFLSGCSTMCARGSLTRGMCSPVVTESVDSEVRPSEDTRQREIKETQYWQAEQARESAAEYAEAHKDDLPSVNLLPMLSERSTRPFRKDEIYAGDSLTMIQRLDDGYLFMETIPGYPGSEVGLLKTRNAVLNQGTQYCAALHYEGKVTYKTVTGFNKRAAVFSVYSSKHPIQGICKFNNVLIKE